MGLNEVAATHKRYLGRAKLLTGIQSGWIKSLLTVWGDTMRGEAAPRCQEAMNAGELLEEIAGLINLLSALLRQLSRRGGRLSRSACVK
jgi:hypothetical protein